MSYRDLFSDVIDPRLQRPRQLPAPNPVSSTAPLSVAGRRWYDPRGWHPDTRNVMLGGGLLGFGDWLTRRHQSQQGGLDRELQERVLQQALEIALMGDKLGRDRMALDATQMNPLAQQMDRQANALSSALLKGGPPQLSFREGDDYRIGQFSHPDLSSAESFFSPGARAAAEGAFYKEVGRISPGANAPDLMQVGYGRAGLEPSGEVATARRHNIDARSAEDAALREALRPRSYQVGKEGAQEAQPKKKGFWGKVGGALKFAAPFALMAIPGLQGAGAGALMGRLGSSAAIGALTGGRRGALQGALGGVTGEAMNKFIPRIMPKRGK